MTSKIIAGGIEIGPLLNAFAQFDQALTIAKSDLEKAGTIQYFEFTYELAWKTLRRILKSRGKDLNSPRTVFREAALEGLIRNPEAWFRFIEDRNETVHTYRADVAQRIFSDLGSFKAEMDTMLRNIAVLKE